MTDSHKVSLFKRLRQADEKESNSKRPKWDGPEKESNSNRPKSDDQETTTMTSHSATGNVGKVIENTKVQERKIVSNQQHIDPIVSKKKKKKGREMNKEEKKIAREEFYSNCMAKLNPYSIICFSDGSCLEKNTTGSPCGAGAWIVVPKQLCACSIKRLRDIHDGNHRMIADHSIAMELSVPLGPGTNNIGELSACKIILQHIYDNILLHRDTVVDTHPVVSRRESKRPSVNPDDLISDAIDRPNWFSSKDIVIFTDSDYTRNAITGVNQVKANAELIHEIQELKRTLETNFAMNIVFQRVPGHIGVYGNEKANELSKNASNRSAQARDRSSHTAAGDDDDS